MLRFAVDLRVTEKRGKKNNNLSQTLNLLPQDKTPTSNPPPGKFPEICGCNLYSIKPVMVTDNCAGVVDVRWINIPRTQQRNVTSQGFTGIAGGFHVMVYAFSEDRTGSGSNCLAAKILVSIQECCRRQLSHRNVFTLCQCYKLTMKDKRQQNGRAHTSAHAQKSLLIQSSQIKYQTRQLCITLNHKPPLTA